MDTKNLSDAIKKSGFAGEITNDEEILSKYSHDASIFELKPQIVVFPNDKTDIENLVKFTSAAKKNNPDMALTARAAGTDMSGGSLTTSIQLSVSKLNKVEQIGKDFVVLEPGAYYRDLEKALKEKDLVYPPYTSSKNICTVGGLVANNAGGEKSLQYGKAEEFVQELKVVLSDGNEYKFAPISKNVLKEKIKKPDFEGQIYKKLYEIFDKNHDLIKNEQPKVSKNSAGYNIWNVWDKQTFDLTRLFVGSQGTLGIITQIRLKLLPKVKHHGMLMIYMNSFENIPQIVQTVLKHNPDSFETYDHHTLRLALKYFYGFGKILHKNFLSLTKEFLPDFIDVATHGMPQLILIVEYENDDLKKIHENLNKLQEELKTFKNTRTKITKNEREREKYWAIRRESFNLLRHRVKDKYASPFIDDTIVDPKVLPEFFPKIYKILNDNNLLYTIAGHIGNGNFHIIPLVDIRKPDEVEKIYKVNDEVFDLVTKYGGSLSGEHNDGLIRTPYLKKMFSPQILEVFKQIKEVFDPQDIFNPGKKIEVDISFAKSHIRKSW